jgi:uncharacterized protein YbjT (DUF2867 family)
VNKILVLGATGMLGAPVAHSLRGSGVQVRVLARDPQKAQAVLGDGFEIVLGDVTDRASLAQALEGCDGVHVSIAGPAELPAAQQVAGLAPNAGVRRITYISGATAFEQNRWFPMTAAKLDAEAAIRACGVDYTILAPTWPMEQLPRLARGGQPALVGDKPISWSWFAADDLGRMVAQAYQSPEATGKKLWVHGPQAISMKEALERYCRAFHPEVQEVPVMPVAVARSVAQSSGNQMLGMFAELMAYFEQVGEMGDPAEANRLLGAPATTLGAWIGQRMSGSANG